MTLLTTPTNYYIIFYYREIQIDTSIETAVSRMQTVIELGRVIRDRKTLPMKVRRSSSSSLHQNLVFSLYVWILYSWNKMVFVFDI